MTCKHVSSLALLLAVLAACGNYSNEDLEFMNAVPARDDISADIPRSPILPANEAELSTPDARRDQRRSTARSSSSRRPT